MDIKELKPESKKVLNDLASVIISNEEKYALEVAEKLGQKFEDIKGMSWFRHSVAQELLDDGWEPTNDFEKEIKLSHS